MKTWMCVVVLLVAGCGSKVRADDAPLPVPAWSVEPSPGTCMGIQPICTPGSHPVCLCQSDLSILCTWICAGR